MCWWAFTGLTHLLIEGPFVFTPGFFAKQNPNYFDEVCKSSIPRLDRVSYLKFSSESRWSF